MQAITPFLWFEDMAEEASAFYVEVFSGYRGADGTGDTGIGKITHYSAAASNAAGRPEGSVMTVAFTLRGQELTALNGGPEFGFTEAISFVVRCADQAEVDYFWERLSEGGEESVCGWLKDRYGLSWQVVPAALDEMLADPDSKKSEAAMAALLEMKKLDVDGLRRAYEAA